MNKLIVDEQVLNLENFEGSLTINQTQCLLHLKGINKINHLGLVENAKLQIHLQDNAKLELEDNWNNGNETIEIISENETTNIIHLFIEAKKDINLILKNQMIGNKNSTNIQIHAVTDFEGSIKIKSIGHIGKNTQDNEFLEELKGLIVNDQPIIFLPDLIVDSDSVIANHNATIKCLDEEELFYLQSKGIDRHFAKNLIKEGFLNKLKN